MPMPDHLLLMRHGESEANVLLERIAADPNGTVRPLDYHDSHIRLTQKGVEQAAAAGEWLRANGLAVFDRYYVSPYARARETAGHLGLHGEWRIDDRIREQNWGEYNLIGMDDIERDSQRSRSLYTQSYWYWHPRGGESLSSEVRARFTRVLDGLHRDPTSQRVLLVTHGAFMQMVRFEMERMVPEVWEKTWKKWRIDNGQILHYSRINPETGERSPHIEWMRSVNPSDPVRSWHGGAWQKLRRRTYGDEELLSMVDALPRILT